MPSGRYLQRKKASDQLNTAAWHHQRTGVDRPLQHSHQPTQPRFMVIRVGRMVLTHIGPQRLLDQRPQHQMTHKNRKRQIPQSVATRSSRSPATSHRHRESYAAAIRLARVTLRTALLAPPFPPPRPHKAAHAEVAEQHQHHHRSHQAAMGGRVGRAGMPGAAQFPQIADRDQRKQSEEDAGNFEPKHSREPHEGAPYRLAELPAPALQPLLHLARLHHRPGCRLRWAPDRVSCPCRLSIASVTCPGGIRRCHRARQPGWPWRRGFWRMDSPPSPRPPQSLASSLPAAPQTQAHVLDEPGPCFEV